MTAQLTQATIDMKTHLIVSEQPVVVEFLNGTVRSELMTLNHDKRIVVFRDQVRVHIRKRPDAKKAVSQQ